MKLKASDLPLVLVGQCDRNRFLLKRTSFTSLQQLNESQKMLRVSRLALPIVFSLTMLVLVSCGQGSPTKPTPPTPPTPPSPPPVQPVPSRITIAPSSPTLNAIGQTVQLRALVQDQNNNALTGAVVSWSSSNASVASVSTQGLVTAVMNGVAQITARSGSASGRASVTVMAPSPNQPPEAVGQITPIMLVEGGPTVEVDVSGAFRDPDGDELVYAAESSDDQVATASVAGTMVTIVPVSAGNSDFTVTATDPDGLSATQTARSGSASGRASVTVMAPSPNQPPEAVGQITPIMLVEGGPTVEVDVSGAFRDPDGDELVYAAESSDDQVATASVAGTMVTIVPVSAGNSDFTVTATDPDGLSATHTIAVTVEVPENMSPEAVGQIAPLILVEGGPTVEVDVSGAFRDPDGDELVYAAESSDDQVATATVAGTMVTIVPVSAGNADITVTATDPDGLSATQTIEVSVEVPENMPPEAVGQIAPLMLVEGGPTVEVDVSGAFRDPDGDELVYAAESSDDQVATASVAGTMVTIIPVSAGNSDVTVTATDPDGLSATQTIAVTVEVPENMSPEAVGQIAPLMLVEGGPPVEVDVSGAFRDPDGDELKYAAESSDGQVATATVAGTMVTIVPVSAGNADITVTATDPDGLSATQTIEVSVEEQEEPENRPPEAVGQIAPLLLVEGGPTVEVDVSGVFRDPDRDELSYTAFSSDDLVTTVEVNETKIAITPVSPGRATVTVRVTDPDGLSASQIFRVTTIVSSPNRETLIELYNRLGGLEWSDRTNWLTNEPLNQWHGVTTDADGQVTRLELNDNNLLGPLPGELLQLNELTVLNLAENNLTGSIPADLGQLASLEALILNGNQLAGIIPSGIEHLRNLEALEFAGNQLSGNIPAEIEHLNSLESLNLSENQLSGPIPPEIGQLNELIFLDLSVNQLTGLLPAEMGLLGNLTTLNVASNAELSGPLPLSLSSLRLESFRVNGTQLCVPLNEEFQEWLRTISDLSDFEGCPGQ